MVSQEIERLKESLLQKQQTLIGQLGYSDLLQLLFDLAIIFEDYSYQNRHRTFDSAIICLGKLILNVIKFRPPIDVGEGDLEEIQVALLSVLLAKKDKKSVSPKLEKLFRVYLDVESLEELQQIDKYDRSCNVMYKGNNEFRTQLAHLEGRQYDIKVGLKYQYQIDFYYNKASIIAEQQIKTGQLELLGKNELDREASLVQCIQKIAALEILLHYGIESEFTIESITYKKELLLEILSLLITYPQSRYGLGFEQNADKLGIIQAVLQTNIEFIQRGGREMPGPLLICTWRDLEERMISVFGERYSEDDICAHIKFFTIFLNHGTEELAIYKTPILRLDDHAFIFVRPLMLQNSWITLLKKLLGQTGKVDEQMRAKRSTQRLATLFRESGFNVVTDHVLKLPMSKGKSETDIDLGAIKGKYLFLLQIKMTGPRATYKSIQSFIENSLKEAGKQNKRVMAFLPKNWKEEREIFETDLPWEELIKIPLVVSTIFDRDRQEFSGSLKISQFELERYLENDAYFLFNNDQELSGQNHRFYEGELSGAKLHRLIQEEKLWQFLDPIVQEKNITDYLPTFSYSG